MLRSAALASMVLRIVAVSSRPSILHRPISTVPTIPRHLLLWDSAPRFPANYSRNYARGREAIGSDDDDDDDDNDSDDFDSDDFDREDFDFDDFDEENFVESKEESD
eukprot:TRINITY_DN2905_c0_g2_i2.p1 TRINITY_DN2905_c0_g2~~TRINITY_DN2905_c0_g2_i2.p1  ORF type:complete len:107 (+),score=7.24 TRINITY_DN2905_c0_g2_i2:60-380(+)